MNASKEEIEMLTRAKALFDNAEVPIKGFIWHPETNRAKPYDLSKYNLSKITSKPKGK